MESIDHSIHSGLMNKHGYHTHLGVYCKYCGFFLIQQLTGFALMNVHSDMSLDIEGVINTFAIKHPRGMKFKNILGDVE